LRNLGGLLSFRPRKRNASMSFSLSVQQEKRAVFAPPSYIDLLII
jgi:hypothetical protein